MAGAVVAGAVVAGPPVVGGPPPATPMVTTTVVPRATYAFAGGFWLITLPRFALPAGTVVNRTSMPRPSR